MHYIYSVGVKEMKILNEGLFIYIIERINENPLITEKKISRETGYSERTIRRYIKILKDNKKILLIKNGKNRCWKIL